MTFTSFAFWLVFPIIFGIYWIIPARYNQWRKLTLMVTSYLLYMNWKPAYAIILFGITFITFYGGLFLNSRDEIKSRKRILWLMGLISLLPLLIFKYYNFVNESIWSLLSSIGLRYELHGLNWAIPVGISFFTFQALGYLFDVYNKQIEAEKSIVNYTLFVCFFPQLYSGPISKANELLPQIKKEKSFDYQQGILGLKFILWGMFLKLVFADRLGLYVDMIVADYTMYNGATCVLAAAFYSMQIYGDFAGYSFMAVGTAKLLGFNLINNFNRPYFSVCITDFWHRWHISLTRWLKDYVYIPLGGSRCSKQRNFLNIFLTFLLSGIWHGANWTFIVWGIIHGVAIIVERFLGLNKTEPEGIWKIIRIIITFTIVTIAWLFFRMPTISDAFAYIIHVSQSTFDGYRIPFSLSDINFTIFKLAIAIVLVKEICEEFAPKVLRLIETSFIKWCGYVVLFCMILLCGVLDSGSFIYGSF